MLKKILFTIIFSIIISGMVIADPTYSLADNQFGNIRYGSDQVESGISVGGATNRTACFPIVAGISGYFDSFDIEFDTRNTASFKYWIDSDFTLTHTSAEVYGYWDGDDAEYFETDELLAGENELVSKGDFKWFCLQSTDSQVNTISGYRIGGTGAEGYYTDSRMVSSVVPLYEANFNPLQIQHSNGTVYNWSLQYEDSGGWAEYSTTSRETPQTFQICYRPTFFSAEDYCFAYSSYEGEQHYAGLDTTGSSVWVGEQFEYTFDDGYAESITLFMYGGLGTSGTETMAFKFYTLEADTFPSIQVLDSQSGISLTNVPQSNATAIQINFTSPIYLEEDKSYKFEVSCDSGCTGGTDSYLLAKGGSYSTNYTLDGFQDETAFGYENNSGVISNLTLDAMFIMDFTTDVVPTEAGVGNLTNCTTNCTTWTGSTYLKEDFIGDISQCDWAVNTQYCWLGSLIFDKTDPYYTIFKLTDLKYATDSRYYTVSFDVRPADIDTSGYLSLSLYDYDYTQYINVLFGTNSKFYNNEEGNAVEQYDNISTGSSKNMQLHIDLTDDDFDVYYDGSKILSGLQFVNSFYNIDNIYGFRLSSQDAGYSFENLEIYASNQNNVKSVVDEDIGLPTPDETKSWCELFSEVEETCTVDSDCDTGECLPNGKCSRFDFTYCDENGHTRGNYCVVAGMTSCVLTSTGDLILDNFFLFLILLILIMGAVYLTIMFRK